MSDISWFTQSVFPGSAEITEEMQEMLVEQAEVFLRCAQLTSAEFQLLRPHEKAAFNKAGERMEEIRCQRIAEIIFNRLADRAEVQA